MPKAIAFEDVLISQEVYAAWQEFAAQRTTWLVAIGVKPEEINTIEEQLELLDDGKTLRLYAPLPGQRGDISLHVPQEYWAWAPQTIN